MLALPSLTPVYVLSMRTLTLLLLVCGWLLVAGYMALWERRASRCLHVSHAPKAGAFLPCLLKEGAYNITPPATPQTLALTLAQPEAALVREHGLELLRQNDGVTSNGHELQPGPQEQTSRLEFSSSAEDRSDPFDSEAQARDLRNREALEHEMSHGFQFGERNTNCNESLVQLPLRME